MEDFDFICISLASRPDRRENSKQLFRKLGILDRIQWWIVEKHPQGGMYGCFESHWMTWAHCTRPYLCVFEDDLTITSPASVWRFYRALDQAKELLPIHLDVLNLEPQLGYVQRHIQDDVYQGGFLHLGCYIAHRSALPRMMDRTIRWFGIDIDTALYKNCRMGGVLPGIFAQRDGPSDNGGGFRNIKLPLESIYKKATALNHQIPMLGWFSIEMAQLLSIYYLSVRPKRLEFKDRRLKNFSKLKRAYEPTLPF